MVDFISKWAEQVVLAVIIATILEMILPSNKSKKYIKMVIGIYILFCIISPFIDTSFSVDNIDLSEYYLEEKEEVNQESMDKRLQQLYLEELEQNIIKKVEEEGYKVIHCDVNAILNNDDTEAGIKKISLEISKRNDDKVSNIEEVEIKVNKNVQEDNDVANNNKTEELRKKISQYYEIEEDKIHIYLK